MAGKNLHHMPRCQPRRAFWPSSRQDQTRRPRQHFAFHIGHQRVCNGSDFYSSIVDSHKRKTVWVTNTLDSKVSIEFSWNQEWISDIKTGKTSDGTLTAARESWNQRWVSAKNKRNTGTSNTTLKQFSKGQITSAQKC